MAGTREGLDLAGPPNPPGLSRRRVIGLVDRRLLDDSLHWSQELFEKDFNATHLLLGSSYLGEGYREDVVTTVGREQLVKDRLPNASLAAVLLACPSCPDNDPDAAARRTRWAVKLQKTFSHLTLQVVCMAT